MKRDRFQSHKLSRPMARNLVAALAALLSLLACAARESATAAASGAAAASPSASAPKRPNIVFIFTDDHAVQSIGAYGSVINKTPNLDRLAQMGAVFDN